MRAAVLVCLYVVVLAWLVFLHAELPDGSVPGTTLRDRQLSECVWWLLLVWGIPLWLLAWCWVQLRTVGRALPWRR